MRWSPVALVVVACAHGQGLDRVGAEAKTVREAPGIKTDNYAEELKDIHNRSAGLQAALRDWIEPQLPADLTDVDAKVALLQNRLVSELDHAGLMRKELEPDLEPKPGFISRIELSHPANAPELLVMIVGAGIPCGSDDIVYVYDYGKGSPRRVLESPCTRGDQQVSEVQFSKRDTAGSRLIFTLRSGAHCQSVWGGLSFDVFRYSGVGVARPILEDDQGINDENDPPYHFRLEQNELLLEFDSHSISADIFTRKHVLHYRIGESSAERIDPVALLPQDFVDEWLTRPWSEMQSRSAANVEETLRKWHDFLVGGDYVVVGGYIGGSFSVVQACPAAGLWQIGIDFNSLNGKELPEPLSVYFLVQQLEKYRFQMSSVSFNASEECPGDGRPSREKPSLFGPRGGRS